MRCPETGTPLRRDDTALVAAGGRRYPVREGIPDLVGADAPASTFRPDRLLRLAEVQERHFWFEGRKRLVRAVLARAVSAPGVVVDVGCGDGAFVAELERLGHRPIGVDLLADGLVLARRRTPDAVLLRARADRLPLADGIADAAVCLDVLEHVDDDTVLAEVRRILKPGAPLVASVPALPWLWSYRDVDAGHRRRYSRASLLAALHDAGFRVEELRGYGALLLPALAATRLLGRRRPGLRDREDRPPELANRALGAVVAAELALDRLVALPWGSTYVVSARA